MGGKFISRIYLCLSAQRVKSIKEKLEQQSAKQPFDVLKEIFTCLICKELIREDSRPVMLPCCRNAICCYECINTWLITSPICPHCRETVDIESCLPQPLIRPMLICFMSEHLALTSFLPFIPVVYSNSSITFLYCIPPLCVHSSYVCVITVCQLENV